MSLARKKSELRVLTAGPAGSNAMERLNVFSYDSFRVGIVLERGVVCVRLKGSGSLPQPTKLEMFKLVAKVQLQGRGSDAGDEH